MLSNELRKKFLDYFKRNGHTVHPSSPVVPHEDPTLLFTNAGMNQFKDVFLGQEKRDFTRAATSQKCVRVGGKHNDLENVGHTRRHLTFFEMIGNFSFGDYFKEEAIRYAWEVSTEVFQLDPNRIWISVFETDDEAFELWTKHLPADRIVRLGEKDNYWSMGDTGPCGPCSELLYDRGVDFGDCINPYEDVTGERFLEFWNLVFMQFNRESTGAKKPLPNPSIDTGAGLERVVSLALDVENVFETDILRSLIEKVEEVSGKRYNPANHEEASCFRVIADHLRCLSFAIADGAQPSNIERGYVLRKVLRRAVRYGKNIGFNTPFLAKVLPRLVETMGEAFPELKSSQQRIEEILTLEEESFFRTLKRGGNLLNQTIERAREHGNHISGADAFKLKDTYGLPIEEITLLAKDAGLDVELVAFEEEEERARERSKRSHKKTEQLAETNLFESYLDTHSATHFLGYSESSLSSTIQAIVVDGEYVDELKEGVEGGILLDRTPFYAEMGGQVGDTGTLSGKQNLFDVTNTISPFKGVTLHLGKCARGDIKVGDTLTASIDRHRRAKIACNHTATHIMHWALFSVLGEHVRQAGSVVDPERLRFDFSHHKALTKQEIREIEDLVNGKIRENAQVSTYEIPYDEASKDTDIKQFFGDKYGSVVRVVDAEFCKELCGGTHVRRTGDIGYFRIAEERSIAAGVRRIVALSGKEAEAFSTKSEEELESFAETLKTTREKLPIRLEKLLEEHAELQKRLKASEQRERSALVKQLIHQKESLNGLEFIGAIIEISPKELRALAEEISSQLPSAAVVLSAKDDAKCHVLVRLNESLNSEGHDARELIKEISPIIEGGGGGKPIMAQAGGKALDKQQEAVDQIKLLLRDRKTS